MTCLSRFAPGILLAAVTSGAVLPAPKTQLEKSATYAFSKEVHAFRAPTTDSAGRINHYDVVIKLNVGQTGVIAASAAVTATASTNSPTSVSLVPGSYKASDGATCTVTNVTLTGARIQSNVLSLSPQFSTNWEFSIVTGPVATGRPFPSNLVAGGVDKRSEANRQVMGIMMGRSINKSIDNCRSLSTINIITAKINGDQIIVSAF